MLPLKFRTLLHVQLESDCKVGIPCAHRLQQFMKGITQTGHLHARILRAETLDPVIQRLIHELALQHRNAQPSPFPGKGPPCPVQQRIKLPGQFRQTGAQNLSLGRQPIRFPAAHKQREPQLRFQ